MGVVKNLLVRVGADFSELQKEMAKAGKYMKNAGKELQAIGKTMTIGITMPILAIGAAGIKTASDLQEVQNVVDTSFGKSASAVNAWSKTTLTAYGLTELQAKQFSGTMRAMLGSMGLSSGEADKMSMSLSGLAGDMASFYNLSQDDAWEKIRSGISGETEPLKQLGINMSVANLQAYALSKGFKKKFESMTAGEQATLRYNYLMETTKNVQGDFEKTSGSFANQLRVVKGMFTDLSGQLMKGFIPYLEKALKKVQEALNWFRGLSDTQKNLIVSFALVAAAIGPVIFILGTLATTGASIFKWGSGISKVFGDVVKGTKGVGAIFTAIFNPAGVVLLVFAALVGLGVALYKLYQNNEWFRNKMNEIWNTVKATITMVLDYVRAFWAKWGGDITALFNGVVQLIKIGLSILLQAFQIIWPLVSGVVMAAIGIIGGVIGSLFQILRGVIDFVVGIFTGDWSRAWSGIKNVFGGVFGGIGGLAKNIIGGVADIINGIVGSIKEAIGWLDKLLGKNKEVDKQKLTDYKTSLIGHNAMGTDNWRGGLTWINEGNKGEIVDLPNGTRVIPHDVSMAMAKGGSSSSKTQNINIDKFIVQDKGDQDRTLSQLQFLAAI